MPTEAGARPRSVTPVGVLADLVDSALERLGAGTEPAVSDLVALRGDLERAASIARGLDPYLAACTTPEPADLQALAELTASQDWGQRSVDSGSLLEQEMLSGHVEGAFLRFLVGISRARTVLEIGMFTGYSALAMARALPEHGRLVACELDPSVADLARTFFDTTAHGGRIDVEVGPALETMARLDAEGARFDLVFIDADKAGYSAYIDALLDGDLLADDGLICVDNTLMQGEPWAGGLSANGRAIADFNTALAADPRVEQVVVPLRDGVTLVRRV